MPELNPNVLSAMRTSFELAFADAFKATPNMYDGYFMSVGDAKHSIVELPFLERFASMREWLGPRQVKNLAAECLKMVEKAYEDTVGIKVRAVETDNWKVYTIVMAQMAQAGAQLWPDLIFEALVSTKPWIDKKNFFSTTRKYGDSLIVNTSSAALAQASFEAAYETMTSYKAHDDKALKVKPNVLLVGPSGRGKAFDIVKNTKIVVNGGNATIDNRNLDLVQVEVDSNLIGTYANDWYLMQTNNVVKPIALQKSKEVELTAMDRPDHGNVFDRDEIIYGTKGYGSAALAIPHLIYRGGR